MRFTTIALLALCVVLSSACGSEMGHARLDDAAQSPDVDFRLASLAGGHLGPEDFRGQVVLFDFWATWCRPCHVQADILASIYAEFEEAGVAFVAVSMGEPESAVRAFTERRPFPYPVLVDPADDLANQLGIFVLPTVMILDSEGRVVYVHEGVSSATRLRHVLEKALEETRTASL